MWTNEQTAALIAAIEEDTLKSCQFNDNTVPHLNYGTTMEKCVFDLPCDWFTIAIKLKRIGKIIIDFVCINIVKQSKLTYAEFFVFVFRVTP